MYNILISDEDLTHICIYYASGIIRYFSIEKLESTICQGIAYVANCNSISVLMHPHSIRMYNIALLL